MNATSIEPQVCPRVPTAVYRRYLRLPPKRDLSPAILEAEHWARSWFHEHARPWTCIVAGDDAFDRWLATRRPGLGHAAIIAVSAGTEAESEAAARWKNEEPDRYYFLECYASAVVDTLLIAARTRLGASRHDCPGYPGWPIEDNRELLAILTRLAPLPGPLDVLDSGMLKPRKSQLAVCTLGKARP